MTSEMGVIIEAEIRERVEEQLEEAVAARIRMFERLISKMNENHEELLDAFFKKERELEDSLDAYSSREDIFDTMKHVAKGAMGSMNEQGVIEFLLIKDPVIRKWWEENQ